MKTRNRAAQEATLINTRSILKRLDRLTDRLLALETRLKDAGLWRRKVSAGVPARPPR